MPQTIETSHPFRSHILKSKPVEVVSLTAHPSNQSANPSANPISQSKTIGDLRDAGARFSKQDDPVIVFKAYAIENPLSF